MSSSGNALRALMIGPPVVKLAVAESITCGHVQARIGAISGASQFFLGGLTAYTLEQKVQLLGVERSEAAAVNAVSESVAQQMARGAIRLFGSDIGIAITGYAELPVGSGASAPFAWWAVSHQHSTGVPREISGRFEAAASCSRTAVQAQFATALLNELESHLRGWRNRPAPPASGG